MHLILKYLDIQPIQGSPSDIDAINKANTTTASERLAMHCSMRTRRVTARAWSYSDLCADYLQACRWPPMPMIKPTLKLPGDNMAKGACTRTCTRLRASRVHCRPQASLPVYLSVVASG